MIGLKEITLKKPFNVAGEWWVLMPPRSGDVLPVLLKLKKQEGYGRKEINYSS